MNNPNRTLLVLKYLWTHTDMDHPATFKTINEYLSGYGIKATDKTLRGDIQDLIDIGIKVECEHSTQNRYFIHTRIFDVPEVKLLIDAIQSSRVISPNKSKDTIRKLSSFVSEYQGNVLKRQLYVDDRVKALNERIYLTVDNIHTAIEEQYKVSFKYTEYKPDKTVAYKHGGQTFVISPYALIWNDDAYYAIGYSDYAEALRTFRVDRMINLSVTSEVAHIKPDGFDVSQYFSQMFSMYNGDESEVELLCENELMSSIVGRFGEDVHTEIVDKNHFKVIAIVSLSKMFYGWVFSSAGKMKIVAPEKAVSGFSEILQRFQ